MYCQLVVVVAVVIIPGVPFWGARRKDKKEACLFVFCLFGGMSKAGEIRTLPKPSLPVAVLRVAKGRIP
jgi:hypothetical protein